ncbi:MAG: hypothetical protein M1828_006139 [Chrysothrix sp. TS-e1954]|nr:MAG: hypothetical protein M1828_006139 [Chrysothrix sp. TS-e1954]
MSPKDTRDEDDARRRPDISRSNTERDGHRRRKRSSQADPSVQPGPSGSRPQSSQANLEAPPQPRKHARESEDAAPETRRTSMPIRSSSTRSNTKTGKLAGSLRIPVPQKVKEHIGFKLDYHCKKCGNFLFAVLDSKGGAGALRLPDTCKSCERDLFREPRDETLMCFQYAGAAYTRREIVIHYTCCCCSETFETPSGQEMGRHKCKPSSKSKEDDKKGPCQYCDNLVKEVTDVMVPKSFPTGNFERADTPSSVEGDV